MAGELSANAEPSWTSVLWDIRNTSPAVGETVVSDQSWTDEEDFDTPPPWGPVRERGRVLATSGAVEDLVPALSDAPYGQEDVALVLCGLDFTNRPVEDHYGSPDHRILPACFSLATQQERPVCTSSLNGEPGGPYHPVRTFVSTGYKHGDDGPCPPVDTVLRRHLGPDLLCGHTRG
ncbi:hypothetical protein [Streptomyces sp. HUAS TT7]|uniref:hypothetical protein n=1 Tax=Streptomyces sp. HUAS TT7 TaxID=3447507 RepID=UPI003F6600C7